MITSGMIFENEMQEEAFLLFVFIKLLNNHSSDKTLAT